MLNIEKAAPPDDYARSISSIKDWESLPLLLRREYREHMLLEEQIRDNSFQCTYCEIEICLDHSCNEHIFPQNPPSGVRPPIEDHQVNPMNITAVCDESTRCTHYKKNSWSTDFIDPVALNPKKYLTYEAGEVVSIVGSEQMAKYTIDLLNLNHKYLIQRRRQLIEIAQGYKQSTNDKDEFTACIRCYPSFSGFIDWIIENYDAI